MGKGHGQTGRLFGGGQLYQMRSNQKEPRGPIYGMSSVSSAAMMSLIV